MKKQARIHNKATLRIEHGTMETCPRCKGYGAISIDAGNACWLCKGYGELWLSASGWTRAKYARLINSQLY